MPTVAYKCPRCRREFARTAFLGEEHTPAACPQCGEPQVKPPSGPDRLFDGIAPFSLLSTDTN